MLKILRFFWRENACGGVMLVKPSIPMKTTVLIKSPIHMKTTLRFASFLLFCGLAFPYRVPASAHTWIVPQIVRTVEPPFPPVLQRLGVTRGSVKLVVKVDKTGKLEDVLVTEYTHREFADEAIKAVKQWTFNPTWAGKEPVGWVREIELRFHWEEADIEDAWHRPVAVLNNMEYANAH